MSRRSGFTLVELLVVVLILAVLMAIALPLYLRAVADSQQQTCRSNMQTIANAEQAYKVRSTDHSYTTAALDTSSPLLSANGGDLDAIPACPNNGDLSVTTFDGSTKYTPDGGTEVTPAEGTLKITCSVHGSYVPGVGSNATDTGG